MLATAEHGIAVMRRAALVDNDARELLLEATRQAQAKRVVNAMRRLVPGLVMRMQRELVPIFQALGEHVAAVYSSEQRPIAEAVELNADARSLVEHILSSARLRDWAEGKLGPKFEEHYERAVAGTVRALVTAGIATDLRGGAIRQILADGGRRAGLVDIVGQTREALFRALAQAQEDGLGPRQTARLIREIVPEGRFVNAGAAYRAELIARTETLHAQRMASIRSYRSASNIHHVIAFDGDKDDQCAARNGVVFTLDDAEVEAASTHPSCVLAFGPISQ